MKNGVYNEINDFIRSGASGLPITIRDYPGHHSMVDGTGKIDATLDWSGAPEGEAHWIIVDGFEIRNFWCYGITIGGDHNSIMNCNIHTELWPGSGEPVFLGQGDCHKIIRNEVPGSDLNGINVQNTKFTEISYDLVYDTPSPGAINIISKTQVYFGMVEGNGIHHNALFDISGAIYLRHQFNNKIDNYLIFKIETDDIAIYLSHGGVDGLFLAHHTGNTGIFNITIVSREWLFANDSADNTTAKPISSRIQTGECS